MTELIELAEAALRNSHAPYSRFRVGAALRSQAGHVYSGCNVECASYPLGGCAERAAIAAAVLAEGPSLRITELHVVARDDSGTLRSAAPCGACRQLILEFSSDAVIGFLGHDGKAQRWSIRDLLPAAFNLESQSA
ncbi:cytidine deaminase [Pseudomarimonas salicorniae]|uniref:Cytidine deaminase n=1 Tax=Pseudomarimonas salicorniae TaxID=2933270 RepID=A0ABT0GJ07_9GAMM|nr:cytidine deaminase [Lysobacter sp. CAU 1642]MCK7594536.1 cytidine deaminase [Lysobacter sp. CAU 1642]